MGWVAEIWVDERMGCAAAIIDRFEDLCGFLWDALSLCGQG